MFLFAVTAFGQQQKDSTALSEIQDLKILFIQIAILLGVSLIVFLIINLRNNRKKRRNDINIKEISKKSPVNKYNTLNKVVDLIPYPAIISNNTQKILHANEAFRTTYNTSEDTWDKCLKINSKNLNISNTNSTIIENNDKKLLKITFNLLKSENDNNPLSTIIIEDVSHFNVHFKDIEKIKSFFRNNVINTDIPTIIVLHNGKIIETNKATCQLIHEDYNQIMNKSFFDFLPPYEKESLQTKLKDKTFEFTEHTSNNILTGKGRVIPVEINVIPITFIDEQVYLFFIKDISERILMQHEILKAQKRAEESDRLKSSFLANISHEVRTPLNSIIGFTELMSDSTLTHKERKEYYKIVKSSSNELLSLLNDIIELSKIESGSIKLNNNILNPHDLMKDLSEHTQQLLENKSDIVFKINEPIGIKKIPDVITDPERIKQVLRHLLNNAVKFTYKGTITLSFNYRLDNSVEFIVSDSGIGIPQDTIPKIFHRFRQATDDNSRDFGGAGLGLSISKHLANALGGFLWVSSAEHQGSDFHFVIPTINESSTWGQDARTIIYYSPDHKPIPKFIEHTINLSIFRFNALLNVPLAHDVTAIILTTPLTYNELLKLTSLSQLKPSTIILYNKDISKVVYTPITKDIDKEFNDEEDLKEYLTECCERELIF